MSKKNKSSHVKLIANPGAGTASEFTDKLRLVTDYLEKSGLKVDLAFAKPKKEATPIAKKASKDGYKIVIAMGGDGTVEAVMRGLIGNKARLGIVPTGTENNISTSLGIPTDLQEACTLIASANTLKLDMGQVTTRKGKKFYFFELVIVGLLAAVYPDANKVANGKLSSIKDAAMTFIQQEDKPTVFLTMDEESKIKVNTMLVVISNTPVFGKKFLVAPNASLEDGLLDISVYPDFGKVELLHYYAEVMNGGNSDNGKVHHYQARKVKIKTSPKLRVMADGVKLGKGTLKIKVRPKALRVITAGTPDIVTSVRGEANTNSNPLEQSQSQNEVAGPVTETMASEAVMVGENHRKKDDNSKE